MLETYEIHILFILIQKKVNNISKCSEKQNLSIYCIIVYACVKSFRTKFKNMIK
jgi:hypothetical protein